MRSDVVAIIDTDRLIHNFRALRACCNEGVKICAPLKADAYGHAVEIVAPALQDAGADFAAVANLQEAVELRTVGWKRPILVLGSVLAIGDKAERRHRIGAIIEHGLVVTIADAAMVACLSTVAPPSPIEVHLKVDSGMGRLGVMPDEAVELVKSIRAVPHLRLTGVYSHFATADFEQLDLATHQLEVFSEVLGRIGDYLPSGVIRHMANSAATITMPDAHLEMVRPGLALFGYLPSPSMARDIDLRPALRVVSYLSAVKNLPPGHCVGYGRTFITERSTRLGIVPIGYCDGYLRTLSNNGVVSTPVGDAPVIGRISMDQLAIDLTDLPPLSLGAEIGLIDFDPCRSNSVAAMARRLGTIPYEVTCLLGPRIERITAERFQRFRGDGPV
ncbi:MAG: alanine racemase [Planctomycetota bacterium]|nr:alanine racemase [Planctomycetota bacterium]